MEHTEKKIATRYENEDDLNIYLTKNQSQNPSQNSIKNQHAAEKTFRAQFSCL